ncbi:MAG: dienelactone hydrolase family protein [Candidatus Staskawiczbacteria bacterium]|nr:dienelactone hydrolase family protein [Candidatus Staskawiczbacteria bacterium]
MKKIILYIVIIIIIASGFFWLNNYIYTEKQGNKGLQKGYKDSTYIIDGRQVTLVNGFSEIESAPGSASKIITKYFGNEAEGDLNNDGISDIVFLLTQEGGGSGTFYYIVAGIKTGDGYQGTNGILLGDRIAPQTTELNNGEIVVNYADRNLGEPMTANPNVGVSRYFKVSGNNLIEINKSVLYYNDVKGYVAHPGQGKNHPAVILIHEWWGLNNDIKEIANQFAANGYVALAVDLYNGESADDQTKARELSGSVRDNTEKAFLNLKSALDYLKKRDDVDPQKIASVGWCFGGGWSYQMALNNLGTKASVMYYGQFDPNDDFEHMKTSIMGHFGEKDASIVIDNVKEFQAKLKNLNGSHEIFIYPNVGHGFANNRSGTNMAYSKEAANLAFERTLIFLENIFK